MTWTYAGNFALPRDQVRFLVGDTDTADQLVTDEQIAFALTQNSNVYRAGAICCRSIALKVGQRLTVNQSGTGIDSDEQYKHWMDAANTLDEQAALGLGGSGAGAYVGGVSVSDKQGREGDSDRVRPAFTRTLHAGPGDALGTAESDERTGRRP